MTVEIAPIPGIRALPAARARSAQMGPPAVFEIDPSAKPEDGREQRSWRKAAGAEESDEDGLALEGERATDADTPEPESPKQIDYFA